SDPRERTPHVAVTALRVKASIEIPEVVELFDKALRKSHAGASPVVPDAALGVSGEILHQLRDQLSLAAKMMMDVGAGDADGFGDPAEAEGIISIEHVMLARDALDALAGIVGPARAGRRSLLRLCGGHGRLASIGGNHASMVLMAQAGSICLSHASRQWPLAA